MQDFFHQKDDLTNWKRLWENILISWRQRNTKNHTYILRWSYHFFMTHYNLNSRFTTPVAMSKQINSWSAQLQKGNYLLGTIIPQKNYALHPRRQKATGKGILSKKKNCWVNPALRYPYRILFNLPRSGMEIREIPMNSLHPNILSNPQNTGEKNPILASSIRPQTFLRSEVVMIHVMSFVGIHLEPKTSLYTVNGWFHIIT